MALRSVASGHGPRREAGGAGRQALPRRRTSTPVDSETGGQSSFRSPREFFRQARIVADQIKNLFDRQPAAMGVPPNYSLALRQTPRGSLSAYTKKTPKILRGGRNFFRVKSLHSRKRARHFRNVSGSLRCRDTLACEVREHPSRYIFSSGKAFATSRMFCVFGYVEFPAKETRKPMSIPRCASSSAC